ncbi:hypothetical protein B0H16DRAFT_1716561 [Mycena metata]|uniref:Uncharacterized protein n=1 Tax=Mycena metata TaxID=1033252 RepID=A0AAD7JLR7_9AGAR|nr:hypothetical protein B0H16DRAFT_1716561 [Mycena metata]
MGGAAPGAVKHNAQGRHRVATFELDIDISMMISIWEDLGVSASMVEDGIARTTRDPPNLWQRRRADVYSGAAAIHLHILVVILRRHPRTRNTRCKSARVLSCSAPAATLSTPAYESMVSVRLPEVARCVGSTGKVIPTRRAKGSVDGSAHLSSPALTSWYLDRDLVAAVGSSMVEQMHVPRGWRGYASGTASQSCLVLVSSSDGRLKHRAGRGSPRRPPAPTGDMWKETGRAWAQLKLSICQVADTARLAFSRLSYRSLTRAHPALFLLVFNLSFALRCGRGVYAATGGRGTYGVDREGQASEKGFIGNVWLGIPALRYASTGADVPRSPSWCPAVTVTVGSSMDKETHVVRVRRVDDAGGDGESMRCRTWRRPPYAFDVLGSSLPPPHHLAARAPGVSTPSITACSFSDDAGARRRWVERGTL